MSQDLKWNVKVSKMLLNLPVTFLFQIKQLNVLTTLHKHLEVVC